ncbi:uncharacterized protein LOC124373571 [Homalodisca vitripennis]|uniref:uncharacterized protein LOC124373571 n=1 Tax=Homalodisca vitripennis TaxID=197043 RepID=UPI001EEB0B7C|nr:uncharacterized protein LOC124373571 [Homalodisca vitripennis]
MNHQKIKVSRKPQKEVGGHDRNKILKEINKIATNPLKAFTACPIQRVVVRKSVPEFRQEGVHKKVSAKAFRSQASQTALGGVNDYEGVVRYPSSRVLDVRPKREIGLQVDHSPSPRELDQDIGLIMSRHTSPVNHVRVNQTPIVKPRTVRSAKKLDPCRAPPSYQRGVVPKYLQKLREEDKSEYVKKPLIDSSENIMDSDMIEKEEKLRKLAAWHQSYKKMVSELNELSVAS